METSNTIVTVEFKGATDTLGSRWRAVAHGYGADGRDVRVTEPYRHGEEHGGAVLAALEAFNRAAEGLREVWDVVVVQEATVVGGPGSAVYVLVTYAYGDVPAVPFVWDGTLWVCESCLLSREGGDVAVGEEDPEPWSVLGDGVEVALGAHRHTPWCEREAGCECSVIDLSPTSCDSCGQEAAGKRWAYSYKVTEAAKPTE